LLCATDVRPIVGDDGCLPEDRPALGRRMLWKRLVLNLTRTARWTPVVRDEQAERTEVSHIGDLAPLAGWGLSGALPTRRATK